MNTQPSFAPSSDFHVESGEIIVHRLFDVCYSIDLHKAEALWSQQDGGKTSRSQLNSTPEKALTFDVPPVLIQLGQITIEVAGSPVAAEIRARVYDFGVIALAIHVPIRQVTWASFSHQFDRIYKAIGPAAETPIWQESLERTCTSLASALTRMNKFRVQEDYLLAVVHQWNQPLKATEVLAQIDLVPLLSGEQRALSEGERAEVLRRQFSYYEDDLVILTWDRAFIYEPGGNSEVCDILEVANAQLLELRHYDELLDDELPRMYDLVEETRRAVGLLSSRRFAHLARKLYTLVAEVTELTEKVENALQVTEDVYLARIYMSALKVFRVPMVSAAVDRKLSIIRETYTALFDEASGSRGELLEIAVVVLIVIEIVIALAGFH